MLLASCNTHLQELSLLDSKLTESMHVCWLWWLLLLLSSWRSYLALLLLREHLTSEPFNLLQASIAFSFSGSVDSSRLHSLRRPTQSFIKSSTTNEGGRQDSNSDKASYKQGNIGRAREEFSLLCALSPLPFAPHLELIRASVSY